LCIESVVAIFLAFLGSLPGKVWPPRASQARWSSLLPSSFLLHGCTRHLDGGNPYSRFATSPPDSNPFDFYDGPTFPPFRFLGYETGDFLRTFALCEYLLRQYGKDSDRLHVFTIGKTPEHRTQNLLAISSTSNARLVQSGLLLHPYARLG